MLECWDFISNMFVVAPNYLREKQKLTLSAMKEYY